MRPSYNNFFCYYEAIFDRRGVNAKARFSVSVDGFKPFLKKLKA